MNIEHNDTIVAISTPISGEGGIGIVRLSGDEAIPIAENLFCAKDGGKLSEFASHSVHYGWIMDENNRIDEVLLTVMKAPKTYTRENIVEISGHGGPVVLRKIIELCLKRGARFAQPGEFTKRAFLNGRIDLAQAEAVASLIRAKTDRSAVLAVNQLKGCLSEKIKDLRNSLVELVSKIEAGLDYSEEDLSFISNDEIVAALQTHYDKISDIIETSKSNRIYVDGVRAAIVGKPNSGKSSLLNCLLGQERAIVTPVPGTTRDIVSETINLKGIPLTIMDTAGIRSHYERGEYDIEGMAIGRSKNAIEDADIVLFVFDISTGINDDDKKIAELISKSGKKTIFVLNKSDLKAGASPDTGGLKISCGKGTVNCSALHNRGIDELKDIIHSVLSESTLLAKSPEAEDSGIVINLRQEQVLSETCRTLKNAIDSARKKESSEFIVVHIREVLDHLGEITGETTTEEILNHIFANFCVGK